MFNECSNEIVKRRAERLLSDSIRLRDKADELLRICCRE